jgi:hypothetical protein
MPTKTQFDLVVIRTGSAAARMAERTTPVPAAIAALSTLACRLPLSFLAAVGLAGASARLQSFRPWLLGSAAVLLGIGFIQLYFRHNQCQKRSLFL